MKKQTRLRLEDFLIFTCIFALVTVYANWMFFTGDSGLAGLIPPFVPFYNNNGQTHLGGEYFSLANAVYEGRGFSDPFGDPTGPSGWSPPILVFGMAAILFLVGGSKIALTTVFLFGQVPVLAFTATASLHLGSRLKNAWAGLLATAIVMMVNFKWIFQVTHDSVFQMFWVNVIVIGLWRFNRPPKRISHIIAWGAVGGLCALAGPAAGLTWAVGTSVTWGVKNWKSIAIVAVTSVFVVSPWVGYQGIRLGKFTPIKSNAAFELYQAQCVLPDGLLTERAYPLHPYHAQSDEGERYREIGEVAYLEEKKDEALKSISDNPGSYLRKTANRFLATTLLLNSETDHERETWCFLFAQFLVPFPFLGLICLIFKPPANSKWVLPAVACFIAYLLPYIFISYYERYGIGVTLPRILLTMHFLIVLKDAVVAFRQNEASTIKKKTAVALEYMPQLDSVRAIAVSLVFIHHWVPEGYHYGVNWGQAGVRLFFILSGFLITLILFRCRQANDVKKALKSFFARRFLRIFPLYYLTLAVAYFFHIPPAQEAVWWYVLYLSNFRMFFFQRWDYYLAHYWSLAVEEQFYLLWPWLVCFVSNHKTLLLACVMVGIGVATPFLFHGLLPGTTHHTILTFANFDALGFGAILAFAKVGNRIAERIRSLSIIGFPLLAILAIAAEFGWTVPRYHYFVNQTLVLLCLVWVVKEAAVGFNGLLGRILDSSLAQYLGRISYGLYVFHGFAPLYTQAWATELDKPWITAGINGALINLTFTVVMAMLSWHLFEQPILKLKSRFQYE